MVTYNLREFFCLINNYVVRIFTFKQEFLESIDIVIDFTANLLQVCITQWTGRVFGKVPNDSVTRGLRFGLKLSY